MGDDYQVVVNDGHATVFLTGEVDLSRAGEAEAAMLTALEHGPSRVRVDLTDVTFMDSTGLRALMVGLRVAGEQGAEFEIGRAQPLVERVLEITGLRSERPDGD